MQGNVVPRFSQQLGALWQGKPALQMNLCGWAAEILPGNPLSGSGTGWPVSSLGQSKYRERIRIRPDYYFDNNLRNVLCQTTEIALGCQAYFFTISLLDSPKQICEIGLMRDPIGEGEKTDD